MNPCTIAVVEPTEAAEAAVDGDGVKSDDAKVVGEEDMDVDADADAKVSEAKVDSEDSGGNSSVEIVRSLLDDIVSDATRPTQEQFFNEIVTDMVRQIPNGNVISFTS